MENRKAPATYLDYRNGSLSTNDNRSVSSISTYSTPPPAPLYASPLQSHPPAVAKSLSHTLLVFVADAPSPDMQVYLSTILNRYAIGEAVIIATNDESLKVSRMDTYTAAGKIRQDILVSPFKLDTPLTSADLLRVTRTLENKTLCGVLCCQHPGNSSHDPNDLPRDLLDYDDAELEASWRVSSRLPA